MSLLLFFIVLAILVLSHEFGHFIVAKFFGIKVHEFGFGFPPRIFAFKYGETEYSLNLIPFGGFVRILGEDESEICGEIKEEDRARSLVAKSKLIQSAVIFAGVAFNFLLAWLLISTSLTIGTKVSTISLPERLKAENAVLTVTDVMKNSPAEKAGLKSGEEIIFLADNNETLQGKMLTVESAQKFISLSKDTEIFVGYKKFGEQNLHTISLTPVSGIVEGRGAIAVSLDMIGTLKLPFFRSIFEGGLITLRLVYSMVSGLINFTYGFFTGESSVSSVSGPVGLVGIVGEAGRQGITALLSMIALISINLAVLNMVPFPALDGGRLLFVFAEAVSGRPISKKITNTVNAFGFLALLAIMFVVTYSDIIKLIFSN